MIRRAQSTDIDRLIEMGRAFFAEAGHENSCPGFTFDAASFARTLALLASHGLLLVVDKGNGPVGMGAIDVSRAYWNHNVVLSREAFWYCDPEYRKGLGRKLLTAMETAAGDYGATVFDVVAEPGPRSKPLEYLYEKAGFDPAEKTFRKVLKRCPSDQSSAA